MMAGLQLPKTTLLRGMFGWLDPIHAPQFGARRKMLSQA